MDKKKIYGLMVLSTLFWSGAFIAGKYSVAYLPVFTLTFLRFLPASILLYAIMRWTGHPYRLQKNHIPVFLLTGTVGMFGYHILFFTCLRYTTAINSSIIGATNPVITAVLAFIALKQRLSRLQAAGVCLSFTGVFLTITGADPEVILGLSFNKGDILMLLAVICWAAYGIISSRAMNPERGGGSKIPGPEADQSGKAPGQKECPNSGARPITPLALTFYSFVVCLILLIPFVILEQPQTFLPGLPAGVWGAVVYMAVFPSVIGYLVQQMAIKEIGPGRTSIFINLVPVFSILLAVLLLDETLQQVKLLTAAAIIAGVIITQKEKIEKTGTP